MEKQIILDKLASLKRCTERIESKTPPSCSDLKKNLDLQDIISLNLQRAVQICVDVAAHISADLDVRPPSSMADAFDTLNQNNIIDDRLCQRMKKSIGYRNIAVHEYSTIDWNIVFIVSTKHLKDFRDFAEQIYHFMNKNKDSS
jgi:uncharacterized protein YutE (UPF0331/DUF86 family)